MKYVILDRQPRYHTLQQDINKLSAEILRISSLPYSSRQSIEKLTSIDNQIRYLEELLAAYEKNQKKDFE